MAAPTIRPAGIRIRQYLQERGVPMGEAFRRWGSFGRAVKLRYVEIYGGPPATNDVRFNGRLGHGCVYQLSDRWILDEVFEAMFPDYTSENRTQ